LIAESKVDSRNNELKKVKALLDTSKSDIEFIVKEHRHSSDILKDCKYILDNPDKYPYDIDGLIFTPAKLAVNSFYPSLPAPITQNMGWDRLFKWKPPEQNTIDFLIRYVSEVKKDGIKYKKVGLYVGFNPITTKDMTIEEGLKLRYDKNYSKMQFLEQKERIKNKEDFIPTLFKPMIYYYTDVEYAHIKIDTKGNIRAENNDNIEDDSIVEFRYDIDNKQWIPIRVREDKTRIFKKGIFSKTANSLPVAINIWRSIHNPITKEMIVGATNIYDRDIDDDIQGKLLEADDVYYARGIPRKSLLSYNMITFHKTIINESLYKKPKHKNALLELACGQAGDMSRWISADYKFVLGIDFAKDNIYKANDGAYARVIKEFNRFNRVRSVEKGYFLNTAFAAGDCALDIRSGEAGVDEDSKELLKIVMNNNNKNVKPYYKYIAGKGALKFDAVTCMFAIHYFFKDEDTLHGFLNNVASNLKKDGIFICTFMDGESVERVIANSENGMAEGRNMLDNTNVLIWAIIKRFTNEVNYNKKVDIFIENTQRLIPEYLVNFDFLIKKAKEYGLEMEDSELFSTTFNKLKEKIPTEMEKQTPNDKTLLDLDKEEVQKKFSFLNRWAVFKKID
jgi:2-polyprenyl-3-methyl-5-hydroxy-6-metoxy-1,4-benzoquinol methylase